MTKRKSGYAKEPNKGGPYGNGTLKPTNKRLKPWDSPKSPALQLHNERVYRAMGWKKGSDGTWRPPRGQYS